MDIISSLNSAFTQVQRTETMTFGSNGNSTQTSYRERENVSNFSGLPGGRGGRPNMLPVASENSLSSAIQNAVSYDRSERGGLQLRTQEGDVVRLKFLNTETANAKGQQFENGGTTLSDFSLSGSNSSRFQVVVEGDLSGEELSAIRDVLIQAREMANTFFDGDVKEAFSMAGQMDFDSEQLANVNMRLNVSETYTYAQTSVQQQVVQAPGVEPDQSSHPTQPIAPPVEAVPPAAPAATSPNANIVATLAQPDVTAAAPTVSTPVVDNVTQEAPVQPETVDTLVHTAPDPVGDMTGVLSTITSFLNQLTESLNSFNQQFAPTQSVGSSAGFSFSAGFQLQVVSSLIGQMETNSDGQTSDAGSLAAKTVDELAMKMDSFVDSMI